MTRFHPIFLIGCIYWDHDSFTLRILALFFNRTPEKGLISIIEEFWNGIPKRYERLALSHGRLQHIISGHMIIGQRTKITKTTTSLNHRYRCIFVSRDYLFIQAISVQQSSEIAWVPKNRWGEHWGRKADQSRADQTYAFWSQELVS